MRGTSIYDQKRLTQLPNPIAKDAASDAKRDASGDGGGCRVPSSWIPAWRDSQAQTDFHDSVTSSAVASTELTMDRCFDWVPRHCD